MKKMTLRGKITIIATLLVVVLIGVVCYFIFRDPIVFKTKEVEVEINESFDPLKNIETVRKGDIKDVKVDSSKVKYDKLGEYDLIYTLDDQKYTVTVKVVDTTKPKFDVVDLDIDLGMKVDPASMVTNIKDATKTKASFKEDYDFSKEGTVDVVVCLTDQGDNVTEKKGKVKIVKDKQAPEISDLSEISVIVGGKVDYNQGVTVSDNRDPEPKLVK